MNQNDQPTATPPTLSPNPLSAMRSDETELLAIKRHPIGLLSVYLSFGLLLAIAGGSAIAAPNIITSYERSVVSGIGLVIFLIAVVFAITFMVIAHKVYYGNRWIITNDSLTEVSRKSLFNTQNSQLGLDNLEDITVTQNGILSHLFNYGTLGAQSAGEQGKFQFDYCPRPNECAQKILTARETFAHGHMYESAGQ